MDAFPSLKTGDNVRVMTGKDAGKTGKIERVVLTKNRLVVAGVNVMKRHRRQSQRTPNAETGIISVAMPIAASNVMLICPSCQQPTRLGKKLEGDRKVRVCKKCQKAVE